MKLLCENELNKCIHCQTTENLLIEIKCIDKNQHWEEITTGGALVISTDSDMNFSFGNHQNCTIEDNQMVFVPPAQWFKLTSETAGEFVIIRLQEKIRLCDFYCLENLFNEHPLDLESDDAEPYCLNLGNMIISIVSQLKLYRQKEVKKLFKFF